MFRFYSKKCRKSGQDLINPSISVCLLRGCVHQLLIVVFSTPQGSPFAQQIQEALGQQAQRMEQAVIAERNRKAAAAEASRKRPIGALGEDASEAKRARTEEPSSGLSAVLAGFDFTALPAQLVTEIIVANLQAMPPHVLQAAIQVRVEISVLHMYLSLPI